MYPEMLELLRLTCLCIGEAGRERYASLASASGETVSSIAFLLADSASSSRIRVSSRERGALLKEDDDEVQELVRPPKTRRFFPFPFPSFNPFASSPFAKATFTFFFIESGPAPSSLTYFLFDFLALELFRVVVVQVRGLTFSLS